MRGLAALHSFWYEEALEAFRESTKVEPDFAMGYWGEAMTYNHPLWSEQDLTAARAVVAKFKETSKLTERERAYLSAVRLLYGDGDKRARDAAYSTAKENITRIRVKYVEVGRPAPTKIDLLHRAVEDGILVEPSADPGDATRGR